MRLGRFHVDQKDQRIQMSALLSHSGPYLGPARRRAKEDHHGSRERSRHF
jgi:hypothetical protein